MSKIEPNLPAGPAPAPVPTSSRRRSLGIAAGLAVGTATAAAWILPAAAQPGASGATGLTGSHTIATSLSSPTGFARLSPVSPAEFDLRSDTGGSTPDAPGLSRLLPDQLVAGPASGLGILSISPTLSAPAAVRAVDMPADTSGGSGLIGSPGATSSPAPTAGINSVGPDAAAIGGATIADGSSDGGDGGASTAAVTPTATSGGTGAAQSSSSATNSGDTGNATSTAIANPSSGSGASGPTGSSGSTESTPSVVNENL